MAQSKWARAKTKFWDFVAWTAKPTEPGIADREAIWSVPRPLRHAYFIVLSLIWWPNLVIQAKEHEEDWTDNPIWLVPAKAFEAFGPEMVAIGIAAAIATLILVQGASYPMVVYQSLVNTFVKPVIKRRQAEGARAQNELWHAWLQRKQQAEAQELDFNEPPPGTDQNSNS